MEHTPDTNPGQLTLIRDIYGNYSVECYLCRVWGDADNAWVEWFPPTITQLPKTVGESASSRGMRSMDEPDRGQAMWWTLELTPENTALATPKQ